MCTFASGVYACNSIILGWVSSTCGQTREKKAVSLALVNTIATIGSIYTPVSYGLLLKLEYFPGKKSDLLKYLWPESDAPRYTTAMLSSAAFSVAAAIMAWVLKRMLIKENRRISRSGNHSTLLYSY